MVKKDYQGSQTSCKVTFKLPIVAAKNASQVKVLGEFNSWDRDRGVVMEQDKDHFIAEVELPVGKSYQYRYLIDNHKWENDWEADDYIQTPFGVKNSVVIISDLPKKVVASRKQVSKTQKATKDDFRIIDGIGPKIAQILKDNGISSFEKLSGLAPSEIQEVLITAGNRYKAYDPTAWPQQAKLAAQGELEALKSLQKELKSKK